MRAFRIRLSGEGAAETHAITERLGTPVEEFLARAAAEKGSGAADGAAFDRYAARLNAGQINGVLS